MISNRLKDIVFKKLYKDLGHVEIIRNGDSIWFIDRESKFWYFNYIIDINKLWWRGYFFSDFFNFFSINQSEFVPIISEWVEEVLNCKVNTTKEIRPSLYPSVKETLNCNVDTTENSNFLFSLMVKETLNFKVDTTKERLERFIFKVDEVLDYQVDTTKRESFKMTKKVDEVLNYKVESTESGSKFSPCVESLPL